MNRGQGIGNGEEKRPRIALVAGETSGDNLGAALIQALRERIPGASFVGIAGPRMVAAGCEAWETADSLAVMGIFEVLPHLRRLFDIRKRLLARLLEHPPDVFIGVDAKEFNLSVERKLKSAGIRTVQYVSPQVWAWRQGRVKKIARAVDLMLCLLPFEKKFYDEYGVAARFVGHPLADQIPLTTDRQAARAELGLPLGKTCVALLPGSRQGEVSRLANDFAKTVAWLQTRREDLVFVAAMANQRAREIFSAALSEAGIAGAVELVDGEAQRAMIASDVVLSASGTATLEATLLRRPMVVVYRLGGLTTFLLKHLGLMKAPFFSQPNLLAGRRLAPEFFNEQVRAEILGPAILEQLVRADRAELDESFAAIHLQLRRNASAQAADAILELLARRPA